MSLGCYFCKKEDVDMTPGELAGDMPLCEPHWGMVESVFADRDKLMEERYAVKAFCYKHIPSITGEPLLDAVKRLVEELLEDRVQA